MSATILIFFLLCFAAIALAVSSAQKKHADGTPVSQQPLRYVAIAVLVVGAALLAWRIWGA